MKIGIVGCGYWGKIIINNLIELGYEDLVLCDTTQVLDSLNLGRKFKRYIDYKKIKCDKVFVLTPSSQHYEVCKFFLEQGTDVFCEKVLTPELKTSNSLYRIAQKNKANLFVDWIFTFNSQVNKIKRVYESKKLGRLKHVSLSRQNFGPERFDVDARVDLASHDVSILFYVCSQPLQEAQWINYKRNPNSKQNDSVLGFLEFENFTASINASWQYSKKDRKCFFDFENGFIEWDDSKKVLNIESDFDIILSREHSKSPLHQSLLNFLEDSEFDYKKQKELTLKVIGAISES